MLHQAIDDLVHICGRPGWDGYGAAPVSLEAAATAKLFLNELPADLAHRADVGADPDGWISLEWYCSPDVLISVSIGPNNDIAYAWRNNRLDIARKLGCGQFKFNDVIPRDIIGIIAQIYIYDQRTNSSN